jgi:hypothetical protein
VSRRGRISDGARIAGSGRVEGSSSAAVMCTEDTREPCHSRRSGRRLGGYCRDRRAVTPLLEICAWPGTWMFRATRCWPVVTPSVERRIRTADTLP